MQFSCHNTSQTTHYIILAVATRPTIVDKAKSLGLIRFLKFANRTGLITMLANDGNFTVFVPSNRAFRSFLKHNPKTRKSLQELTVLLRRHIVVGVYTTRKMGQDQLLASLDVPQKLRATWSADKKVSCAILPPVFHFSSRQSLLEDPSTMAPNSSES